MHHLSVLVGFLLSLISIYRLNGIFNSVFDSRKLCMGFLWDVVHCNFVVLTLAVWVFGFPFRIMNATVVRDGYIFAVLVDSHGFRMQQRGRSRSFCTGA